MRRAAGTCHSVLTKRCAFRRRAKVAVDSVDRRSSADKLFQVSGPETANFNFLRPMVVAVRCTSSLPEAADRRCLRPVRWTTGRQSSARYGGTKLGKCVFAKGKYVFDPIRDVLCNILDAIVLRIEWQRPRRWLKSIPIALLLPATACSGVCGLFSSRYRWHYHSHRRRRRRRLLLCRSRTKSRSTFIDISKQ